MKKTLCLLAALLVSAVAAASAQESHSPMYYWEYTETVTLHGKSFYGSKAVNSWGPWNNRTFADSYKEQDGYALVNGRKLRYWLYDTITYHDGDASFIYDRIVPEWVEGMGYVIDFDHIKVSNPNTVLVNSVKALMKQRGADVSVTLVTRENDYSKGNIDYVVINEYLNSKDVYKTTIYYLYK